MAKGNVTIEENSALMNGKQEFSEPETFGQFLYNKENHTVLGRTATSWCQITVFYIIFYTLLTAFWVACLAIFLNTLDEKVPRYYGKGTIIGINPGVGYQPWIKENPDSTLIKYNLRDPKTAQPYIDQLERYLSKYNSSEGTRDCGESDDNKEIADGNEPCRFDLDMFENNGCGPKTGYGFKSGSPCIALSLNRLIAWEPVDFPEASIPEEVKDRYKKGNIALFCDGTNGPDQEHVGKVKYIPSEGIQGKYYPYAYVPNYQQPIAMVKFDSVARNKLVLVECRAYAMNIIHDITTRLGMVHFEMFIEDKEVEQTDDESR